MKLAPHLHRLGNDVVACYLIDTPDGITLIDAGLPGHWRDLQRELSSLGKSVDDIRGLVLTHGDSDHIGFAERLRSEHGVPVFIHAADAARARTGDKPKSTVGPLRPGPTLPVPGGSVHGGGIKGPPRYCGCPAPGPAPCQLSRPGPTHRRTRPPRAGNALRHVPASAGASTRSA
ncbi:MBL fold metallo-hydrolase [Streptomyces sp. NPDC059892]|uniref:MBL fold metallo-hydrolase n=1 Tax=Streptomyces sp. NPDC059892 TaxID=3346989 RepID=UPI00364D9729